VCASKDLVLRPGARVSAATQQNPVIWTVHNSAAVACSIEGYPVIAFYAGAKRLAFTYAHGGGQQVTRRKPTEVVLAPGADAYFIVNKSTCEVRTVAVATSMRVRLSGDAAPRQVSPGRASLGSLCSGPTTPDPGNTVHVSPVEPTIRDLFTS
jgi:hypothetical protein